MSPEAASKNEAILARIEELGGGYVWESEIFAVTLMDVALENVEAEKLCALTGVEQIALNASLLNLSTLQKLASIPGLSSLVITLPSLTSQELDALVGLGPEVQVVEP